MAKKVISYCDSGQPCYNITIAVEHLQMLTSDYHTFTLSVLPLIKLNVKVHKQITTSLLNGNIELIYHYLMSGSYSEEEDLVKINQEIKLQEVAPTVVLYGASQYM